MGKEAMNQYLCSRQEVDETCHGEGLQVATRIRLPQGTSGLPKPSEIQDLGTNLGDLLLAGPTGPSATPPVSPGISNKDMLDLLS